MASILYFILFAAGLLILVKGSDWFVDSAVWAAEAFRIPSIIIGATIVSICTTLPETFVSASAVFREEYSMAVGNALGSIGVNTGLILAILLFFMRPFIENRREFLKNGTFLACLLLLVWIAGMVRGEISRLTGAVLILLLVLYIINNVISARKLMDLDIRYDVVDDQDVSDYADTRSVMPEGISYDEAENDFNISLQTLIRKIVFFVLGIFFVVAGSNLLVVNGIRIAEVLHVPHFLISVIFTAIGTSLPELTTVITSIRKCSCNLGIGNIIGASILNIIQVIGISAIIAPLPIAKEKSILLFQLPILFVMAASVIGFGVFSRGRMSRWSGFWLFL